MEFPRPLSANERAVLEALIPEGGFEDADVYRAQLDHATVVARCTCGCPSIDLQVDATAPRSVHAGDPSLPLWGSVGDPGDVDGLMDIVVWAPEGALTELEVMYYGSGPPTTLPDAADVRVGPGPDTVHVD